MPTFITLSSYPFCFPGGHSEKRIKKGHRLTAVSLFAHFAETLAHMAVNPIFSSFLIQPWLKQGGGANRSSLNFKALPYCHFALYVYELLIYSFHRTDSNIVHLTDPCHLVGGFHCFSDLLRLGHLLDDSVHQLLRLLVNAGELGTQFPAQQQSII